MSRGWRTLQATTAVGAVRRTLLGQGRLARTGGPGAGSTNGAPTDAVVGRTLPRVPQTAGSGPETAAAVRARALAAGLPESAAAALEGRWATLPAAARRQVAAPLRPLRGTTHLLWGTDVAVQTDGTTCGSAVLAMLAAAGDPGLALWLATGTELPGYVPPEVRFLRRVRPGALPLSPQRRFASVQLAIKHVTNVLGPVAWPHGLGTPPWGAAHAARFGPVRFRGEMVDDGDRRRTADQLARATGSLEAGVPVPLYVQGDLGGGVAHAVPRHVVLLTGVDGDGFAVYEPGRGLVGHVSRADLLAPRGPQRALGGWSHAAWILLPRQ